MPRSSPAVLWFINGCERKPRQKKISFGVEHIQKEIRKFIGNNNVKTKIYRIHAYDSIICGYFCIGFIDFMLKDKSLLEYTNLFSPNEYKKNDKITLKYFQ